MANKRFYQAAAAEVQAGDVDHALWIKVNADFSDANSVSKQAQYIRLRAAELSQQSVKLGLLRFGPRAWWQWVLYLAATFVGANIVAELAEQFSTDARFIVFFPAWLMLIIAVVAWGFMRHKVTSGSQRDQR